MKNDTSKETKLRAILKETGTEKPEDSFSIRLTTLMVDQFGRKQKEAFNAANWLGKLIIGELVAFNIFFLLFLGSSQFHSVLFLSAITAVLGVWGIIVLSKFMKTIN